MFSDLNEIGHAGSSVNVASGHSVIHQFIISLAIQYRTADMNAGIIEVLGTGGTCINEQGGDRISLFLFSGTHDVIGLGAEYTVVVCTVFRTYSYRCAGENLFRNPAHAVNENETILIDPGDDEADHIHVGKHHQCRCLTFRTLKGGNAVADLVDAHFVSVFLHIISQPVGHFLFIA